MMESPMIETGSPAPALELPTDGGGRVSLEALKGRPVVVFFYPKADTPGCTTESQDFSTRIDDFAALGAAVIGVSKDPVKKLDRFKAKHDLKVILASDETDSVCEAWGVWGEKQLYGRKFMGIERSTFLIAADGTVARAWRKVSVKGHAEAVLEALRGQV
jgi:peroxiredoxin Q/BCP